MEKYRAYELLHARWAMLAAAGIIIPEGLQANGADLHGGTWFETGAEMLNGGTLNYFAVPWGVVNNPLPLVAVTVIEVGLMGAVERYRWVPALAAWLLGFVAGCKMCRQAWLLQHAAALQSCKAAGFELQWIRSRRATMQLRNSCAGSLGQSCLSDHKGSHHSCCTAVLHCITCVCPAAGNRARGPRATAQALASLTARSSRGWTTCTLAGHLTLWAWCVCLSGLLDCTACQQLQGCLSTSSSGRGKACSMSHWQACRMSEPVISMQCPVMACACSVARLHQGQGWALHDRLVVGACSREVMVA